MNKRYLKYCLIITVLIGLSSCKIQKDYIAPKIEEVSNFRNNTTIDSTSFANMSWWEIFNDSTLVS